MPTEGQLIRDRSFLKDVWLNLVAPLVDELCEMILGYSTMPFEDRMVRVIELNEPYVDNGDWLMLGWMPVYAGCRLGEMHTDFVQSTVTGAVSHRIERYVQRFSNDLIYTLRFGNGGISDFINRERETYERLPISYRVALVSLYIIQNVNVAPEEADAFALGIDRVSFEPRRVTAFHIRDNKGRCSGWLVRLRDSKPSQTFSIKLAQYLRNTVDEESPFMEFVTDKRKRAPDNKFDTALGYVEDLERQGIKIGRGGSMTWDEVAGQLTKKYGDGVRAYTGNNLRDSIRKHRQREGER